MSEKTFTSELFRNHPKLNNLIVYFDNDWRLIIHHINGLDWCRAMTSEFTVKNEDDRSVLVELDFSELEMKDLCRMLLSSHISLCKREREWIFFAREWNKPLSLKNVLLQPAPPFPYLDIHQKAKAVFLANPELTLFDFNQHHGLLKVSCLEMSMDRIMENWVRSVLPFPRYLPQPNLLWEIIPLLQARNISYGGSFFCRSYYI